MPDDSQTTSDEFTGQCNTLGAKLIDTLFGAPEAIAICTIPGVMAAVAKTFGISQETMIEMFISAMEDIDNAE